MKITIDDFDRKDWLKWSEAAHGACFKEKKPAEWDRIDFALVARTENTLLAYVTCHELDAHTVYFQFGGSFPETRGSVTSWHALQEFLAYCGKKYKRVAFRVENTNTAMLRLAMKAGFVIIGCRYYAGSVLLEHLLELPCTSEK